jgi:hypothetical protein
MEIESTSTYCRLPAAGDGRSRANERDSVQGPSKQAKLNLASTPSSQRLLLQSAYVSHYSIRSKDTEIMDPYSPEGGQSFHPSQEPQTPLTDPRAYKHPLRIPCRRIPTSPRFRHVKLLLIKCAARSRPEAALANRSRPSIVRLQRTCFREDTRPRRSKAASGLRTRQRCRHPG